MENLWKGLRRHAVTVAAVTVPTVTVSAVTVSAVVVVVAVVVADRSTVGDAGVDPSDSGPLPSTCAPDVGQPRRHRRRSSSTRCHIIDVDGGRSVTVVLGARPLDAVAAGGGGAAASPMSGGAATQARRSGEPAVVPPPTGKETTRTAQPRQGKPRGGRGPAVPEGGGSGGSRPTHVRVSRRARNRGRDRPAGAQGRTQATGRRTGGGSKQRPANWGQVASDAAPAPQQHHRVAAKG